MKRNLWDIHKHILIGNRNAFFSFFLNNKIRIKVWHVEARLVRQSFVHRALIPHVCSTNFCCDHVLPVHPSRLGSPEHSAVREQCGEDLRLWTGSWHLQGPRLRAERECKREKKPFVSNSPFSTLSLLQVPSVRKIDQNGASEEANGTALKCMITANLWKLFCNLGFNSHLKMKRSWCLCKKCIYTYIQYCT